MRSGEAALNAEQLYIPGFSFEDYTTPCLFDHLNGIAVQRIRRYAVKIPLYQIDAFTAERFRGNPAAVCLLESWVDDATMQNIAAENNLAETAFVVSGETSHELRWFTPEVEIDLCGHATLAAAHALRIYAGRREKEMRFHTKSGILSVQRLDDLYTMNFPSRPAIPADMPEALARGLGKEPMETLKSRDFLAVYEREQDIVDISPDFSALKKIDCFGIIAAAPGNDTDFVSRFFAPGAGIPEDPVTGSSHCTLIPYWSARLGKRKLSARQLSRRGGELFCEDLGERVNIGGRAVVYLEGEIIL